MPGEVFISAPIAPIPPALATAIDRLTGEAPAIGASRIGMRTPSRSQNILARSFGRVRCGGGVIDGTPGTEL